MFVMNNNLELTKRQEGLLLDGRPKYLRNYLKLKYLFIILKNKYLVLRGPEYYKDKIDKKWVKTYIDKANVENLYTLCCTWETELIHHWNCFAGDNTGCYLMFNGEKLLKAADDQGINHGFINYIKNIPYNEIPEKTPVVELPFSKAWAYRCEYEYRFVSPNKEHLIIDLDCIEKITITAKMDNAAFIKEKKCIEKYFSGRISLSRLEKDNEE